MVAIHIPDVPAGTVGRPAFMPSPLPQGPFTVQLLRLESGDYDAGGAYWGASRAPKMRRLYWFHNGESGIVLRADRAADAAAEFLKRYPTASVVGMDGDPGSQAGMTALFGSAFVAAAIYDAVADTDGHEDRADWGLPVSRGTIDHLHDMAADFLEKHRDLMAQAFRDVPGYAPEVAAMDLLRTMDGAGSGFWSLDSDAGEKLASAASLLRLPFIDVPPEGSPPESEIVCYDGKPVTDAVPDMDTAGQSPAAGTAPAGP